MTDTVDSLKQRLVGAFVIVTLAIIFLPMIFDKPHQQESIVVVPVPPKPEFKTIEITKPVRPDFSPLNEDKKSAKVVVADHEDFGEKGSEIANTDHTTVPEQKQKTDETSRIQEVRISKPIVDNLSVFKNVWMVQLGTFSNVRNAYKLRDKLRKDGFDGHTKSITLNGKKAVKVFSGPFVKKRDAIKVKKRLDNKYKVDSRVVFFDAK